MKEYRVRLSEESIWEVRIDAKDEEDAMQKAKQLFYKISEESSDALIGEFKLNDYVLTCEDVIEL